MLEILKNVGIGTPHEYSHNQVYASSLPPRKSIQINIEQKSNLQYNKNIWYDKIGICYKLIDNNLIITAKDFFPETIVDYINALPNNLNIILSIMTRPNEMAGLNMLCSLLSRTSLNKSIILDISNLKMGIGCSLEIENLPTNVKISNCVNISNGKEDNPFFGENSFDWWALHCIENNFKILLSKLTENAKKRAEDLRKIAYNFYRFVPENIKSSNSKVKCDFVYKWCCANIHYDFEGTMPDGSFNFNRRDTQDPIVTFNRRKGVCAGRSRLLKVLLNNYYMKTPIFLVRGLAGIQQHEWNELIADDGESIVFDISKMPNLSSVNHDDYLLSKFYMVNKNTQKIK